MASGRQVEVLREKNGGRIGDVALWAQLRESEINKTNIKKTKMLPS
jgi:hypothetical protein